jgi:NAD(P)H dehydrogenase (quinone)
VFVVLGASGNTGKVVAEALLSQNKKVRVVVRDIAKGQAWQAAGADVSIADVEDGAALEACIQRRGGCLRSGAAALC